MQNMPVISKAYRRNLKMSERSHCLCLVLKWQKLLLEKGEPVCFLSYEKEGEETCEEFDYLAVFHAGGRKRGH